MKKEFECKDLDLECDFVERFIEKKINDKEKLCNAYYECKFCGKTRLVGSKVIPIDDEITFDEIFEESYKDFEYQFELFNYKQEQELKKIFEQFRERYQNFLEETGADIIPYQYAKKHKHH